ncbi:hypothetical protein AAFF27_00370 [Xylophilus sp. GW821-FHT01B05]
MAAQINTFLVIADARFTANWHCVEDGQADAVLRAPVGGSVAVQSLLLGCPGSGLPDAVLPLPLQMEDFVVALGQVEQMLGNALVPRAPAAAGNRVAQQVELRLKRWPPALALMEHKYYPRLASFMSRPVTLSRLSLMSNVPMERCVDFVDSMQALGIVENPGGEPVANLAQAARPGTVEPSGAAVTPVRSGLVQRLRARLGIAGGPRG